MNKGPAFDEAFEVVFKDDAAGALEEVFTLVSFDEDAPDDEGPDADGIASDEV